MFTGGTIWLLTHGHATDVYLAEAEAPQAQLPAEDAARLLVECELQPPSVANQIL